MDILRQHEKFEIEVFLDSGEIRDFFDIEFLLRRGVELPVLAGKQSIEFREKLAGFKDREFKVKLGSILENDIRNYYVVNRFRYLEEKLDSMLTNR